MVEAGRSKQQKDVPVECPIDQSELIMSDRSGVEIDYCPKCRGVWLDRGELDKIIERSMTQPAPPQPGNRRDDDSRDRKHESERDGYSNGRGRKKDNWLGELFG